MNSLLIAALCAAGLVAYLLAGSFVWAQKIGWAQGLVAFAGMALIPVLIMGALYNLNLAVNG